MLDGPIFNALGGSIDDAFQQLEVKVPKKEHRNAKKIEVKS
jgi:hypothetical protein